MFEVSFWISSDRRTERGITAACLMHLQRISLMVKKGEEEKKATTQMTFFIETFSDWMQLERVLELF